MTVGLVLVGVSCEVARADAVESRLLLEPDRPVHRVLTAEQLVLGVDAAVGDFVRIVVEQQEVDLVLALAGPGGKVLAERDSPTGAAGEEELSWVAERGGLHLLTLRRADVEAPAGALEARLAARRPATAEDRRFARAEALAYEALLLSIGGDPQAHDEALTGFQRAADLWCELGVEAQARRGATVLYQLAGRHHLQRPEVAEGLLGVALDLWRWLGDRVEEAKTLNRLGMVQRSLGDHLRALATWQHALELRRQAGDFEGEARTLTNLGAQWNSFGEAQRALDAHHQALAIWDRLGGDRRDRAATFNSLGLVYRNLGDYPAARRYYERALKLVRRHENRQREATTLNNLAWTHHLAGELRLARQRYNRALKLSHELDDSSLAAVHAGLGRLLLETGKSAAARRHLEAAVMLQRKRSNPNPRGLAAALQSLGDLERHQGRLDLAHEALAEGLEIAESIGDRQTTAALKIRLARLEGGRGHLDRALALGREALGLVEELRGVVIRPDLRAAFTASRRAYYETHLDLLYAAHRAAPAAGYAAEAFETAERAHARSLLETLAETDVDLRYGVDPALLEKEARLERQLNVADQRLQQLLSRGAPPETTAALENRIAAWIEELRDLEAELKRRHPFVGSLVRPQPLTLRQLQEGELREGELLLELVLGDERSSLWAVSRDRIDFVPLPPRRQLESMARGLVAALAARGRGSSGSKRAAADRRALGLARQLSETLLGPVAAQLGDNRLIIVPDGALHYVPFAALPVPGSGLPAKGAKWFPVPLVARHELSLQPSVSTIALLRDIWRRRPAPSPALAVWADPVLSAYDARLPRLEGARKERKARADITGEIRSSELRAGLTRLYHAAEEAAAIGALRSGSRAFVGLAAQRETLRDAQRYGVLHFATHSVIDPEHPELSRLALSMFDAEGEPSDGFLRLHDIYELELNADLVVLSACSTALGKEVRGEGLVSLTRGFLHAGARRVVASQWDVEDRATARLMEVFYRGYLEEGLRPAEALRRAQLELAAESATAAPFFWAGFLLQGEWR